MFFFQGKVDPKTHLDVFNDEPGGMEVTPEEGSTSEDVLVGPVSGLGMTLASSVIPEKDKNFSTGCS